MQNHTIFVFGFVFSFFFSSAKSLNLAGPGWARLLQSTTNIFVRSWQDYLQFFSYFSIANTEKKGKENWANIVSHQIMSKMIVCAYVNNDLSEAFCFASWLNFGFFSML